jgi:hypothetical protein
LAFSYHLDDGGQGLVVERDECILEERQDRHGAIGCVVK